VQQERGAHTGSVIWSQLFLRLASSAGVLVIGGYFVYLRDQGEAVNSVLLGGVSALVYVTELLLAPVAGSLGDRRGRKLFLLAGPALSAVAVLLIPLGATTMTILPVGIILGLVSVARLAEGVGTALSVPATLGFLAETTDEQPMMRGRFVGFFELASSVGIAAGAVLGPLLWARFHVIAFVLLAGVYLIAALVVLGVRERPRSEVLAIAFSARRYVAILSYRPLALFIPTWIAVNAILGVWVSAQIEFVLAARLHVPGQHFVGSLHGRAGTLSEILGGYVLWFAVCVVAWAFVLGRLPRLPTLLITVSGSVLASLGLIALNHGGSPIAFIPIVLAGVFLEAGFTPTALAYLADISQRFSRDRGLLMGLYSVMLGVGQLAGAALGGLFAQFAYFDGLAYLTIVLASAAMGAVALSMMVQRGRGEAIKGALQ
jgi:MFS family permease